MCRLGFFWDLENQKTMIKSVVGIIYRPLPGFISRVRGLKLKIGNCRCCMTVGLSVNEHMNDPAVQDCIICGIGGLINSLTLVKNGCVYAGNLNVHDIIPYVRALL